VYSCPSSVIFEASSTSANLQSLSSTKDQDDKKGTMKTAKKRSMEEEASLAKKAKPNTSSKRKFDKETVEAASFCTAPTLALSREDIDAVMSANEQGKSTDACTILTEKELVGKGTKRLFKLLASKDDGTKLCFYYDGKKCVKKDRLRIEAMVEKVRVDEQTDVLLAGGRIFANATRFLSSATLDTSSSEYLPREKFSSDLSSTSSCVIVWKGCQTIATSRLQKTQ